ncbi:MAG: flagellar basal body P-ring formation chaperone FlgA [Planctomycetota bacterium]
MNARCAQLVLVCLLAVLCARVALGDRVVLRASAVATPGEDVTLGDVATLEGDDAMALADLVVLERGASESSAWREVTIRDVRASIIERGVRASRVALSGSTCRVWFRSNTRPIVQATQTDVERMRTAQDWLQDESMTPLRAQVVRSIAAWESRHASNLKIEFDVRDDEFLDGAHGSDRVAIEPVSAQGSPRVSLRVRLYSGESLAGERTIHAMIECLEDVAVASERIGRSDLIGAHSVRLERRWMRPGSASLVRDIDDVDGWVAKTRIDAGDLLRLDLIEKPICVERGELVDVISIVGGIEVRTRARAQRDAREGDLVELQRDGARNAFTGVVQRRGLVLVGGESDREL